MSKAKVVSAKELAAFKAAETKANAAVQSLHAQEEAILVEKADLARVTKDQQSAAEEVARLEAALKAAKTTKDKAAEKRLAPELDTAKIILKAKEKLVDTTAKSLAKTEKAKEALSKEADKAIADAKKAGVTAQTQYNPAVKPAATGPGANSARSPSEAGSASSTFNSSTIDNQLNPAQTRFANIISNVLSAELDYLRFATTKPLDLPDSTLEMVAKGISIASGLLNLVPTIGQTAASVLSNVCTVAVGLSQDRRKKMAERVVAAINSVSQDDYKAIADAFAHNLAVSQAHLLPKLTDKAIAEHAAQAVESVLYALMHDEKPEVSVDSFLAAAFSGRSGAGVTSMRNTKLERSDKGEELTSQGALTRAGAVTLEPSGSLIFLEPTGDSNTGRYGYNLIPFSVAQRLIDSGKFTKAEKDNTAARAQSSELRNISQIPWHSATIGKCKPITEATLEAHTKQFLDNHQTVATQVANLATRMTLTEEEVVRVKELVGELDKRVEKVEGDVSKLSLQANNQGARDALWTQAHDFCVWGNYLGLEGLLKANPWLADRKILNETTPLAYVCCDGASKVREKAEKGKADKNLLTVQGSKEHVSKQAKCLELLLNSAQDKQAIAASVVGLEGERVPLAFVAAACGALPCLQLLEQAGVSILTLRVEEKSIADYAYGKSTVDYIRTKLSNKNLPSPKDFTFVDCRQTVAIDWAVAV